MLFCHGSKHSKGTVIMFNPSLDVEIIEYTVSQKGRLIILERVNSKIRRMFLSTGQYKRGTADCGLRTADCGLRTADCGLRTADCGLRTADCGLRTADCGLRTADCGLRTADCGLRTADCGLRTADCGLRTGLGIKRGLSIKWGLSLKIAVLSHKSQKMLLFQFSPELLSWVSFSILFSNLKLKITSKSDNN